MNSDRCRACKSLDTQKFLDLGFSPPSNEFLNTSELDSKVSYFPLRVMYCRNCWMVQTQDFLKPEELFTKDYVYMSSVSSSWLEHCRFFAKDITSRLSLGPSELVLEIASNDGYLLQFFQKEGMAVLGIEPTRQAALQAMEKGVETRIDFFSSKIALELLDAGIRPQLVIANNVLAHVPDLNDFIYGLSILLQEGGTATIEFPHLLNLIRYTQFDTIYHEHFSYLSLMSLLPLLRKYDLAMVDVEKINTHGGSLRVYIRSREFAYGESPSIRDILQEEIEFGLNSEEVYQGFREKCIKIKNDFLQFLLEAKNSNKRVFGYGAAAKANTLLNFSGVKNDLIEFVIDKNPAKQNKYMPGSFIKVVDPSILERELPDYLLLFPWNIKSEILKDLSFLSKRGVIFVTALPSLEVISSIKTFR